MTATSREGGTPPAAPLFPPEAAQDEPTRWERWKHRRRSAWRSNPLVCAVDRVGQAPGCGDFRERAVDIGEGEFLVVPHGVEHRSIAAEEVHVLLLEPATTLNTGTAGGSRTKDVEWI